MKERVEVFVANANDYGDANFCGVWVFLPISDDEITTVLDGINLYDNKKYYVLEWNVPDGYSFLEDELLDNFDIRKISKYVSEFDSLDEEEQYAIRAYYINAEDPTFDKAKKYIEKEDYKVYINPELKFAAEDYLRETIGDEAVDIIHGYMDFSAYADDFFEDYIEVTGFNDEFAYVKLG